MSTHHPNRALPVAELEDRRMAAGRLFTKGRSAYSIEKHFGVSSTTAREWRTRWQNGTLAAGRQGRVPKLTEKQQKEISALILKGPEAAGYATQLWTLARITEAITKTHRIAYRPRSVWHVLGRLGFSCQRPVRRAKERNEAAIRRWVKTEWPKLRKRGHRSRPSFVSGMNPAIRSVPR